MALPEVPETIDAVAHGLSLVHEGVRAIRETVTATTRGSTRSTRR